ncbi:MAG: hypothetical protein ACPGEG_08865 [Salibacteraceae bacterium]
MFRILVFAFILVSISSCKKDKVLEPNCESDLDSNYFPLSVGSYWVYDSYKIDSLGNEVKEKYQGRIEVVSEINIGGINYKSLYAEGIYLGKTNPLHVRDSSGYIVSDQGEVLMSYRHFNKVLESGIDSTSQGEIIVRKSSVMYENQIKSTALGTYGTLENKMSFMLYEKYPGASSTFYANGVGIFIKQVHYTHPWINEKSYLEYRLVDYRIRKL